MIAKLSEFHVRSNSAAEIADVYIGMENLLVVEMENQTVTIHRGNGGLVVTVESSQPFTVRAHRPLADGHFSMPVTETVIEAQEPATSPDLVYEVAACGCKGEGVCEECGFCLIDCFCEHFTPQEEDR
jgi:hypothetical protein